MAITQLTEFAADELVSRANVNSRVTDVNSTIGTLTPVQLYYNVSGSTGTIALSQSIENFQVIEIFFSVATSDTFYSSVRVFNNGNNSILTAATINIGGTVSGTTRRVRAVAGNMRITGTELSHTRDVRAIINGSSSFETGDNTTDAANVHKIVGYKY